MIRSTVPVALLALASLSSLATPASAQAGPWSQFRGPGGLAVADDAPLPAEFGPEHGVLWKAEVPAGHSSPCVLGAQVFVTGFEDGRDVLLAFERASGKLLWSKSFEGPAYRQYSHPAAVPALPTTVADDERVIAYFGNYGLVAFTLGGEPLWEKRLPQPSYGFGVGSSPLLFDGVLVLARDGAAEAAVLALDASDGSDLWRINRFEFGESHGTPFLWHNAEREELVIGGSGRLCSYDPGTGKRLWSLGGLTSFPCTTPTADRDTLYFAAWSTPNASGRSFWEEALGRSLEISDAEVAEPALLFRRLDANGDGKIAPDEVPECRAKDAFGFLDGNASGFWEPNELAAPPQAAPGENLMVAVARGAHGDLTKEKARWSWDRGLPYVSSPLCYRGRIWLVKAGGMVTVLDAAKGEPIIDRARLSDRGEYYMSPVGAAGHVLLGSADGTLYVLDADAKELTVQQTIAFDEELFATPAVLDGTIYLRTKTTLWAFGSAMK